MIQYMLCALFFLLPWQTRYIFEYGSLHGRYWEYSSLSLYATELLLWFTVFLFIGLLIRDRSGWKRVATTLRSRRGLLASLFVLLVGGLFLTLVVQSTHHFLSYYYLFHALEATCLAYVITDVPLDPKRLYAAFWLGGVGQAVLGVVQFVMQHAGACKWFGLALHTGDQIGSFVVETGNGRWLRAYGSFGSPNMLGAYLAITFIIGLLFTIGAVRSSRNRWSVPVVIGQMVVLTGLLVTFSRGAWLSAMIGALVFIAMTHKEKNTRRFIFTQFAVYLLLILCLVVLLKPLVLPRLEVRGRLESKSLSERTSQYTEAKRLFFLHPALGVGPGLYTLALYESLNKPPSSAVQPVHNTFFLVLVEFGVIAGALWVVVLCRVVKNVWIANPLGLSLVSVFIVSASLEHFWWTLYTGVIMIGVIFALANKKLPVVS